MANLMLAIPADLKAEMKKFAEINWSEVACQAIVEKIQTLEAMDRLLARSALTERQANEVGRQIRRRVWKKHRRPA